LSDVPPSVDGVHAMTGLRARPEWIAKHPDQPIPKIVKLRIWEREGGRCYLSGKKIMPGDAFEFEHVIALANGGEHREGNIRLALKEAHRAKTSADAALTAKIRRQRLKHIGGWPASKTPLRSRGFQKTRPLP
jgi:5-methylcytosine-specific restriction protein A